MVIIRMIVDKFKVLYAKVDGGILGPVANGTIETL